MPDEPSMASRASAVTERTDAATPPVPDLGGEILDGRYRLDTAVRRRGSVALWKGTDLVLARAVAVRVLVHHEALDHEPERLLAAARHAGRLVHVGAASTYDATTTSGGGVPLTYIVSEWVDGRSLGAMLDDGPLSTEQAVWAVHALAQVLAVAHDRRVAHGDLHPGDVVVTSHGQVKVLDLEVRAALEPEQPAFEDRCRRDLVTVAALLYAALTAHWPGPGQRGLIPAPEDDAGRLCTMRQLRAGVPRELDALVMGVLVPGSAGQAPGTMREFAERLERCPALIEPEPPAAPDVTAPRPPAQQPTPARRRRRRRRRGWLAAAAVAVLMVAALLVGLAIGRLPGSSQAFPSAGNKASAAPLGAPLPIASARSFDPEGDGAEQPDRVPLAHDGDTGTAWSTDTYTSAQFGQLKSGVGLLVDLGSAQRVRQVRLVLGTPGGPVQDGAVQLRAADTEGSSAADYPVVAGADPAGADVRLTPSDTQPHRFWLLWITRLPATGGGYRADVAELAFLP